MFIVVEADSQNSDITCRYFLMEDFQEGNIKLQKGQELCLSHGDDDFAVCEITNFVEYDGYFRQFKIPLRIIVCKKYKSVLVEVKPLA